MTKSSQLRILGLMLVANAVLALLLNEYILRKFVESGMNYGAQRWAIDAFCLIAAIIGSGVVLKKSDSLP